MNWTVTPLDAIGPLKLGATRTRLRETAEKYGLELKHATDTSDYFTPEASVQVEYNDDDRAWFIGINATPINFRLLFEGIDLFATDAHRVFELFDAREGEGVRDLQPEGLTFGRQIVALWKDDPDSKAWTQIAIGTREYLVAVREVVSPP
jgi:hypothetical protein